MDIFPRLNPEFLEKCYQLSGVSLWAGSVLGTTGPLGRHLQLLPIPFSFQMDPKGNENFLFPRNLQKRLCFSGVRAEGISAGVSLDLPCSVQVAELTTKMEVPAVSLESGLSPRDPQEFNLSQLVARGFKAPGPHPRLHSTLYQPKPFILENPAILSQQAIHTIVPC